MVQGEPILGILVDVDNPRVRTVTVKDCLEEYYRVLKCDTIDCTHRVIGGVEYDIVCDDNGLLTESPVASAIDGNNRPILFGNLFIVRGNDETGEWESLTKEDIENILGKHALVYIDHKAETFRPVIVTDGEYGMGVSE